MKHMIVLGLLSIPAVGATQEVTCPLVLPENAYQVTQPPAGWRGSTNRAFLSHAGMLSGPPEQLGYLIPDKSVTRKNGSTETWSLRPGEEKWLWCGYERATIRLFKRMDDGSSVCKITGHKDRDGIYIEMNARCK